ncbi:hypothetical protein R1flu_010677 [Riccia fluitans]|uniref:Uncharacterized protein n=1 Tax=Riccia fluitans TaxID=41844 RepID=A0ABD1Z5U4_9MARC
MREGAVKCPNCCIPFHRVMIQKFYMERISPPEHAATYFVDPVQLRRSRLILPFMCECLDFYLVVYECGVPLDEHKEMLFDLISEVDTKFPNSVLDEEDRFPGPYDLHAEVKRLLRFYLCRQIANRELFAEYMQDIGTRFTSRTWPPE